MPVRQLEPIIYCMNCNQRIVRRRSPCGAEEPLFMFKKRKFCNSKCRGEHDRKINVNPTVGAMRYRQKADLMKNGMLKERCEICGSESNVEIHHIDKNPLNGEFDNLKFLCAICHGKTHRRICPICGMDATGGSRGYCQMHYMRLLRHGDPNIVKKNHKRKSAKRLIIGGKVITE